MSIKPILFNTEMVKAILIGIKTQTRRLVKPQPPCVLKKMTEGQHAGAWCLFQDSPMLNPTTNSPWGAQYSPPYQSGDILWVRETWCKWWLPHGEWSYKYKATSPYGNTAPAMPDSDDEPFSMPWRPSIHMPREAARIFLKVKDVRAEQLQSITMDEIRAEGLTSAAVHVGDEEIAFKEWELLWNSTVKKDDLNRYGWAANPWVWVIEFERCEKPEGWNRGSDTA